MQENPLFQEERCRKPSTWFLSQNPSEKRQKKREKACVCARAFMLKCVHLWVWKDQEDMLKSKLPTTTTTTIPTSISCFHALNKSQRSLLFTPSFSLSFSFLLSHWLLFLWGCFILSDFVIFILEHILIVVNFLCNIVSLILHYFFFFFPHYNSAA